MAVTQPWTGPTAYDIEYGVDPEWDAFLADYNYRRTRAGEDAKTKRSQTDESYQGALKQLEERGVTGNRNINTNALARGVFRSGERDRRLTDLTTTLTNARTAADKEYSDALGQIVAAENDAYMNLDLERERQVATSRQRISDRERELAEAQEEAAGAPTGGGGGGGGAAPPSFSPPPAAPSLPSAPTFRPVGPSVRNTPVTRSTTVPGAYQNSAGYITGYSAPKPQSQRNAPQGRKTGSQRRYM